jgi:hypothetical protein
VLSRIASRIYYQHRTEKKTMQADQGHLRKAYVAILFLFRSCLAPQFILLLFLHFF